MTVRVLEGDCLAVMPTLDAGSVDAIVTDPPYGLTQGKRGGSGVASIDLDSPYGRARIGVGNGAGGFMGMKWDAGVPGAEYWAEALRVAKPGAHLVAFGGTRTFHRLTCAIEDAGWEIRDCLSWLYGSGFPKSHNGPWGGTALKPAWEPIVLARKPLAGTVAANHAEHGTGALNIDGCRINPDEVRLRGDGMTGFGVMHDDAWEPAKMERHPVAGRWPANVVLDEDAAAMLDAQTGELTSGANPTSRGAPKFRTAYGEFVGQTECTPARGQDSGGASRFFYTSKASRAERNAGLEDREEKPLNWSAGTQNPGAFQSPNTHRAAKNSHPTVKPLDLMQWLCRLVTPKGGLILDPFCGSGTTGRAAVAEGFRFIGIELSPEYAEIARARIAEYAPLFGDVA